MAAPRAYQLTSTIELLARTRSHYQWAGLGASCGAPYKYDRNLEHAYRVGRLLPQMFA